MPSGSNQSLPTFEAAMSLVNSKVSEQRERGLALLENGHFLPPESSKVGPPATQPPPLAATPASFFLPLCVACVAPRDGALPCARCDVL